MKSKKIFWLILLPFVLYAQSIFTSNNRANVWIEDGSNSKSFFVDTWSEKAELKGTDVFVSGNLVSSSVSSDKLRVLVNDVPTSYPLANVRLPYLSLIGFDRASSLLGESLSEPSLSISPNGGDFNKTIEVVFRLNAPADMESTVVYNIDGSKEKSEKTLVANDGNNSFAIYLTKEGDHNISYMLKGEDKFRVAHFTLKNSNAKRDSDGDGIPDRVEAELGMDPFDTIIPDSDNDGWNDWEEYVRDENTTDSDGDGWSDWDEIHLRETNPNNPKACVDIATKPTANSLYGVEYIFSEIDGFLPSIERASLVNVKSEVLLDTTRLIETEATQASEQQLCTVAPSDLNLSLSQGLLPQMRVPADLAMIERIREHNLENNSSQILKAWTDAVAPITLNDYLASENFATLGDDFNASSFKEGYIEFLQANLLIKNHHFSANRANSINVALVESAMRSRDDSPALLVLGDPDFKIPLTTYTRTLKALGEENRTMNDLYSDLILVSEGENTVDKAVEAFNRVDENTTEERLAYYMQNGLTSAMHYKLSLMTILGMQTVREHPSVLDLDANSDTDAILNKDEVLPLYYTHPLKGDSDNDGVDDKEDVCPNDANNQCINDAVSTDDSDGDGINDAIDNCPFDVNLNQSDRDGDGIGDVCAKKGIVMVTPRTNIQLFKGDSFTFEAKKTQGIESEITWFINKSEVDKRDLTFEHTFNTVGREHVCVLSVGDTKAESCVDVTVLERELHDALNIYTQDILEGDSGDKNLLIEVVLDEALPVPMRYRYETVAQTATKNVDYRHISGELLFEAGEVRKYLMVPIIGDILSEDDETFKLSINEGEYTKAVTIRDDDIVPTISMINPHITTTEGTGSNHTVTFNFALDVAPKTRATVDISPILQNIAEIPTIGAISGNGKVTFEAGETTATMEVTILGDSVDEYDKTVHICFENPQNLQFTPPQTEIGVISNSPYDHCVAVSVKDDDAEPTVSFDPNSLTVSEATGQVYGTLKLSHLSTKGAYAFVSVSPETNASSDDYTFTDVNLSFFDTASSSYVTERSVELNITDDDELESLEKVVLEISSTEQCRAVESNKKLTVNIQDNEVPNPVLSVIKLDSNGAEISGLNVDEADVDKNVTFRLHLSSPVVKSGTSVHYAMLEETATLPAPDAIVYPSYHSMIRPLAEGDIVFAVGEQDKDINVTIIGDVINESDKAFTIRLSEANNIKLHDLEPNKLVEHPERKDVTLNIVDNDPLPTVSFEQTTYTTQEGQQVGVKLLLSEKSYQTVEVNLTVDDESTATLLEDYNLSATHVVIEATSPTATVDNLMAMVDVNISQGLDGEDAETIILEMNSSKNTVRSAEANRTVITIEEEAIATLLSQSIVFNMNNGTDGYEPWISDGTIAHTDMIKDLVEGSESSNPSNFTRVADNTLYFTANDAEYNRLLFKSDGTADNTVLLQSLGQVQVENLLDVNGVLYFTVSNYGVSIDLWRSNGTSETTQKVKTLFRGYGIEKMELTLIGDTLYFASSVIEGDIELYKYNITTDVLSLVKDLKEGDEGSFPHEMINVNGVLYFTANGNEIWKSEGTSASTVLVAQLHSDPDAQFANLTYTNGIIYFTSSSGETTSLNGLNVSSGITTSNIAVYDGYVSVTHTAVMGNKFYYVTSSNKLFHVLGDVVSADLETKSYISDLKIVGETFYIHQNDALIATTGIILKSLSNEERVDFVQETLNGELFFHIYKDTQEGSFVSLWKTDGTMDGTQELVAYGQAK